MPWAFMNDVASREGLLGLLLGRREHTRRVDEALVRLPLGEADELVLGRPLQYYRECLDHEDPADPLLGDAHFRADVVRFGHPVALCSAWVGKVPPEQLDVVQRLVET